MKEEQSKNAKQNRVRDSDDFTDIMSTSQQDETGTLCDSSIFVDEFRGTGAAARQSKFSIRLRSSSKPAESPKVVNKSKVF